jgi:hypothetical protein
VRVKNPVLCNQEWDSSNSDRSTQNRESEHRI